MPPEESTFIEEAVTTVTDFAGQYTTQALVVIGVAIVIGLGIWGFRKLVKLFRSQAN